MEQNMWTKFIKIFEKIILPIVCAAISGIVVWLINPGWEKTAREQGWISQAEWKTQARLKDWLPKSECPANPVKLSINSPGDESTVFYSKSSDTVFIKTQLIIEASKRISSSTRIGLIIKPYTDPNCFVDFPYFTEENGIVFSTKSNGNSNTTLLNFRLPNEGLVIFWAFLTDDKNGIGEIYSNISQIEKMDKILALSTPISIYLKKEK
jgi:hypothetical protein